MTNKNPAYILRAVFANSKTRRNTKMKITAIVMALAFVAASPVAVAGVTPNSAASAASQSGAKVAPAKSNSKTDNSAGGSGQTETAK